MSGSGSKHSSKRDMRDEPEFSPDSVATGNSSKWSYSERNDNLKPRAGFSCKEPFSGRRGSNKDDITNENYRVLDATIAWDTDGSHGMKMSPGFVEGKNKKHSQSPKDGYSRPVRSCHSRSRSPPRGIFRDSGVNDRNRMRAGGLAQPCRDFPSGKCRRGSHCHFLHHDNQNYEDSWDGRHRQDGTPRYSGHGESGDHSFTSGRSNEACIYYAKGRCRMGALCKFEHRDDSDKFGKVSMDESPRVREFDRKRIENSFEQGDRHGPNHNGDIPCKFFAFGNCRNGKSCRFSHDMQASRSPNRRLRDDRPWRNQGGDQALDSLKLSDSISPKGRLRDDIWRPEGSMAVEDKFWDGPKHIDFAAISDTAKLAEDNKNGMKGSPPPGFPAWPMNDGRDHSLEKNREHGESPFSSDKKEAIYREAENDGANIRISQSIGTDIWPGDEKMSPDWNYGARSSSHVKEEHGQNKQQVATGQGYNQNVNNLHSSSCHVVGQSQVVESVVPSRIRIVEGIQNQDVPTEKQYIAEPNIMDARLSQIGLTNPPTQNMVSKEQLAQLTSLSASLAHILKSSQQLPQLCATLSSHDVKNTPFLDKAEGSGNPVSMTFIKPDPPVAFQKQYDPIYDSLEPKNANASGVPPTYSPIKEIPKDVGEIPSLLSNLGQNFNDSCKTAFSEEKHDKSEHIIQLQQGANNEVNKQNNEVVAEEKKSYGCGNKITKENSPLENMDQNDGPDEAKKTKDAKGIRAFKFSLVEFVKELLKPTWKEGQITKEDYKAIVKKVTDKVTGTVQRVQIPQTKEKIDRYLSCSKPKLNKLIQAYVEKVQKA